MSKADDARRQADMARDRLKADIGVFKTQTRPQALLGTAKRTAQKRALQAGIAALSNAKIRPVAAAGVAVAAIAYLFRNPILKALRKRADEGVTHD